MLKQKILEMPQEELVRNMRKGLRLQTVFTAIQAYNCFGTFPNKVVFALAICSWILMAANLWSLRIFVLYKQSSSTIVPYIYTSALLVIFLAANLIIILSWESNTISGLTHLHIANYIIFVVFSILGLIMHLISWRAGIFIKAKYLLIEAGTADDQGRIFDVPKKDGEEP